MAKEKKVEQITDMEVDFAQWFTDVCKKAELIDYSSIKGMFIYRPYGYAIWENIQQELDRMAGMVRQNVDASFLAVLEGRSARLPEVEETEEYIDYLNKEISKYISRVIAYEQNAQDSALISSYLKITNDLERIGDHATNIAEWVIYSITGEHEK